MQRIRQYVYPTDFIRIGDMVKDFFECFKYYVFRLEYSLDDYQNQRIPWTYQTFRRAIWITLNSWINILFISHIVLEQSSMLTKTMKELTINNMLNDYDDNDDHIDSLNKQWLHQFDYNNNSTILMLHL